MTEFAQKQIDQNKRTQARFLDLGRCGLTELPREIMGFDWLEKLSIGDIYLNNENKYIFSKNGGTSNQFKSLDKIPPNTTNFQADEISISNFTFLSKYPKLNKINLSNNQIQDYSFLSQLKGLHPKHQLQPDSGY